MQTAAPERMLHVVDPRAGPRVDRSDAQPTIAPSAITKGAAFVVCTAIGLDAGGYSFPYIAGYAGQRKNALRLSRA